MEKLSWTMKSSYVPLSVTQIFPTTRTHSQALDIITEKKKTPTPHPKYPEVDYFVSFKPLREKEIDPSCRLKRKKVICSPCRICR